MTQVLHKFISVSVWQWSCWKSRWRSFGYFSSPAVVSSFCEGSAQQDDGPSSAVMDGVDVLHFQCPDLSWGTVCLPILPNMLHFIRVIKCNLSIFLFKLICGIAWIKLQEKVMGTKCPIQVYMHFIPFYMYACSEGSWLKIICIYE